MPDLDLTVDGRATRVYELLHRARPVLLHLDGGSGALDGTPWADRVDEVVATAAPTCELPLLGTVDVPADFSQNLVSGSTNDPKRAEITLRRNDANGFVIGSVTGSAQDKITEAVNQTAVKSYFEAVFSNLQKIREGMISARDGSTQLATGIASP